MPEDIYEGWIYAWTMHERCVTSCAAKCLDDNECRAVIYTSNGTCQGYHSHSVMSHGVYIIVNLEAGGMDNVSLL